MRRSISTSDSARPVRRRTRIGLCVLVAGLGLGSAGCSVFTSYVRETAPARQAFQSHDAERAAALLEAGTESGLESLAFRFERGTVLHTAGSIDASTRELLAAAEEIEDFDRRAVVSASESAAVGASLLLNEKTIAYEGEPFERVLVHAYLALNFLFAGDPEGARVEIRRLQQRQRTIRERAEREGAEARDESGDSGVDVRGVSGAVDRLYADQADIGARVQNLYDDAFAYAISAVVYDLNDEANDAFIDLRRAMELRPELLGLKRDAYRAAKASGLSEDAAALAEVLGEEVIAKIAEEPARSSELVVVFQAGDAPLKREVGLPIPTGNGLTKIALPKYEPQPHAAARAVLLDATGRVLGATELYTDVEAIAIRTLRDRMAVLALKQAARAVGKAIVAKQASDQLGDIGLILASLWNLASEQADLRGWTTLPANLQLVRIPLAPGTHRLTVVLENGAGGKLSERQVTVELGERDKRFVNIRATGPAVYVTVHPGGPSPEEEG